MAKHGVLIVTETPALPWDLIFHLERACKNYLIALFHHLAFNSLLAELASRAFATASAAEKSNYLKQFLVRGGVERTLPKQFFEVTAEEYLAVLQVPETENIRLSCPV